MKKKNKLLYLLTILVGAALALLLLVFRPFGGESQEPQNVDDTLNVELVESFDSSVSYIERAIETDVISAPLYAASFTREPMLAAEPAPAPQSKTEMAPVVMRQIPASLLPTAPPVKLPTSVEDIVSTQHRLPITPEPTPEHSSGSWAAPGVSDAEKKAAVLVIGGLGLLVVAEGAAEGIASDLIYGD
jgi:hypothetical protein